MWGPPPAANLPAAQAVVEEPALFDPETGVEPGFDGGVNGMLGDGVAISLHEVDPRSQAPPEATSQQAPARPSGTNGLARRGIGERIANLSAPPLTTVTAAAKTDAGPVRRVNEDAIIVADPVYMVADGMGGHEAGDAASAIVAEEMERLCGRRNVDVAEVKDCVEAARQRIAGLSHSQPDKEAGTTLSGVVVTQQEGQPYWLVVNLGDSRTYRFSRQCLEQLSVDHSEVQELISLGRISPEQARDHPDRNVVTKALGAGVGFTPDYWWVPISPNDRILVCSDGLTGVVPDSEIALLLAQHPDPGSAVDALMAEALRAGATDNVSLVVVNAPTPPDAEDLYGAIDNTRIAGNSDDTVPRVDFSPVGGP